MAQRLVSPGSGMARLGPRRRLPQIHRVEPLFQWPTTHPHPAFSSSVVQQGGVPLLEQPGDGMAQTGANCFRLQTRLPAGQRQWRMTQILNRLFSSVDSARQAKHWVAPGLGMAAIGSSNQALAPQLGSATRLPTTRHPRTYWSSGAARRVASRS